MNQDKDQEDFQTRGNQPPSPSPSPSSPSPRSLPSPCLSNIAGVVKYRNILLGVTGSVAAVKAPEVAVRLCREVVVDEEAEIVVVVKIKILLTAGASNFWEQSKQYNEYWWNELQSELQNTNIDNNNNNNNRNNNDNTGHNNNNNNNNNKDNNHNHNAAHNMDNSSNTRISRIEVLRKFLLLLHTSVLYIYLSIMYAGFPQPQIVVQPSFFFCRIYLSIYLYIYI